MASENVYFPGSLDTRLNETHAALVNADAMFKLVASVALETLGINPNTCKVRIDRDSSGRWFYVLEDFPEEASNA